MTIRMFLVLCASGVAVSLAPVFAQTDSPAARREMVVEILRFPGVPAGPPLAEQHANAMRALGFDALPLAGELLTHNALGIDAAQAMLRLDQSRAMPVIFGAIPAAQLGAQLVGFEWFLEHESTFGHRFDAEAHDASIRVLSRIESTAVAQLALYTIGASGTVQDFPLLQRFADEGGRVRQGLRTAAEAALIRLGSAPHLDRLRADLATRIPEHPTYAEAATVAQTLRQAAFSANTSLVPLICTHVDDPAGVDIDLRIEPAVIAGRALSLLLEPMSGPLASGAPRRSQEQWRSYCSVLPRP